MDHEILKKLENEIITHSDFIAKIKEYLKIKIVGQENLIEKLILAVLADGHIFLEGVPGLAKTLIIKTLADIIDTKFQRIQFTPDLLPADIIGTLIYNQSDFQKHLCIESY